jgi:hypothetical protein
MQRTCLAIFLTLGVPSLLAAPTQANGHWILENPALRVVVDSKTANWDVLDKRCGQLWPQATSLERQQWVVPIRQAAGPPVLDGALDEWPGSGISVGSKLATTTAATPTSTDGDQDSSARFHLAWDAAGWWLAADVTDDKLVAPPVGADLWHVDSIELWLGKEHWGLAPDGDKVRIACWSNPAMAKDCRAVGRATTTGWRLEAFIPWSRVAALPKGPSANAELLLAVGVNDCDGGPKRQCQLFYPPAYKHKVMNTHALARLGAADTSMSPSTRTQRPTKVVVKRITALPTPAEGVQVEFDYTEKGGAVLPLTSRVWLLPGQADVAYELSGDINSRIQEIALPAPFVLDAPKGVLVIPQGAGLLFGVEEISWHGGSLGGKMSMPWFGSADLATGKGYIGIMGTPDDAKFRGAKVAGTSREVLAVQPLIGPQKGKLGYARRFLYHFADTGSYVTLAKRYRAYVKQDGRLKTLAEKRQERPNIDRLVGAVNIYSSHFENLEELHRLGVERAVVSGHGGDRVRRMNNWGYLTGRYDIYTDLYEPGTRPSTWERCQGFHFPEDVIKKADGSKQVGWCPIPNAKTGKKDPSYVACWSCGLRVLRERVPKVLAKKPLNAYFLDCVTSARLYECYDPRHPLTRTTDREARIAQFDYLSSELKLVVGSETGRDWAVPVADYFEGIMSTASFFATPKAIHEIPFVSIESNPRYEEYAINPKRRVPLFQLVYGDCAEITWRWGDNTHRMPKLWAMKDLQHIIHASMPMFVLWDAHQDLFLANTERFKETYDNVCRWRRAVGYHEMTNHERLSEDAMVQRSSFANGAAVTVNFAPGERIVNGIKLPSRSFLITGDAPELKGLPVGRPVQVSDPWEPKKLVLTGNTGFEKRPFFWRATRGMKLSVQSEVVQNGTHAAKLSGTQDNTWSFARAPNVPLEAGRRYRMTCQLRVDDIAPPELAPKLKCELHKDGKYLVNIYTHAYDLSKLGTWQKLEKVFTVAAGADSGALALEKRTTKSVTATLYLDEVKLIPLPAKNP